MDRLMTSAELAQVLGLSPLTIKKRDPKTLPPAVCVPGARGRRWRQSDVQAWLESLPRSVSGPARPGRRRRESA
ncbi:MULTISPECIES: helix-turn-helix transcriptional regulator [Acidithiobacillus]|uniref:helix-turn-helix transcriptional regulator n=2 Tax=Acidithiobacillus TaxID=119977 RepID=UPI00352E8DBC|nr:helix-turn-helix domain-containing protein [Acidithiobacillus ferriphilus]MBW9255081.1 helix-turn-helix domain-containing protein [Acidithiobacillus ferriphilus]